MRDATARFVRHKYGVTYFAEVAVVVDTGTTAASITEHCAGDGWLAHGGAEDASAQGYDAWKAGAFAGVAFACGVAALTTAHVDIRRITGMTTDTNPTIVSAAAALAVWQAVGFVPSDAVRADLETRVFESWRLTLEHVPDFSLPALAVQPGAALARALHALPVNGLSIKWSAPDSAILERAGMQATVREVALHLVQVCYEHALHDLTHELCAPEVARSLLIAIFARDRLGRVPVPEV